MKFSNNYEEIGSGGLQISLRPSDAAELLSLSEDAFRRHVMPHLRTVSVGRLTLIPRQELDRWLAENAFLNRGT